MKAKILADFQIYISVPLMLFLSWMTLLKYDSSILELGNISIK